MKQPQSNKIVATATAPANIALIKYWGKRDATLNLPTKSSISVTLPALSSTTSVKIIDTTADKIFMNGEPATAQHAAPIIMFLDLFRAQFGLRDHFQISTTNSFPTAAGLASSASGFAALTKALNNLYQLNLPTKDLSILARRGSGSASRSLFNGFAKWEKGEQLDGSDSYAEQLFNEFFWPEFCVIVCMVTSQTKKISSRAGMQQTVATSPTYSSWLTRSEQRLNNMQKALSQKDFITVGQLAQDDCLDMHMCMQTTNPPLNYWTPTTIQVMDLVKKLHGNGLPCFFTIDAGPNVKILTLSPQVPLILEELTLISDLFNVMVCPIAGKIA